MAALSSSSYSRNVTNESAFPSSSTMEWKESLLVLFPSYFPWTTSNKTNHETQQLHQMMMMVSIITVIKTEIMDFRMKSLDVLPSPWLVVRGNALTAHCVCVCVCV